MFICTIVSFTSGAIYLSIINNVFLTSPKYNKLSSSVYAVPTNTIYLSSVFLFCKIFSSRLRVLLFFNSLNSLSFLILHSAKTVYIDVYSILLILFFVSLKIFFSSDNIEIISFILPYLSVM